MDSKSKFMDIFIEKYNDNSIVVRGDTRKYKEDIKKLGGKYNARLSGGPGWIFPKTSENEINNFIKKGIRIVSDSEALEGETRSKEWETKRTLETKKSNSQSSGVQPTLVEYANILTLIKNISAKMDFVEKAMLMLLSDNQKKQLDSNTTTQVSDSDDEPVVLKRLMKNKEE